MSDRKRQILAVILLLCGMTVILIYGLRSASDERRRYRTLGRTAEKQEAVMPNGTVSINEADADELTELYGIGESLAALIVDERNINGKFWYPEDLTAVKGIGIRKLNGFRGSINLD